MIAHHDLNRRQLYRHNHGQRIDYIQQDVHHTRIASVNDIPGRRIQTPEI